MSREDNDLTPFEQRARAVLEESVTHIDARVRSRLNQARQAAVAQLNETPRAALYRNRALAPVGVAAGAAVLFVALAVWYQKSPLAPLNEGAPSSLEDIDLLADGEALDLVEDDGAFYEWAVEES